MVHKEKGSDNTNGKKRYNLKWNTPIIILTVKSTSLAKYKYWYTN